MGMITRLISKFLGGGSRTGTTTRTTTTPRSGTATGSGGIGGIVRRLLR